MDGMRFYNETMRAKPMKNRVIDWQGPARVCAQLNLGFHEPAHCAYHTAQSTRGINHQKLQGIMIVRKIHLVLGRVRPAMPNHVLTSLPSSSFTPRPDSPMPTTPVEASRSMFLRNRWCKLL